MRNLVSRTALRLGAGAMAGVLLLPGCSAGPSEEAAQEPVQQEEIDKALETPTELTFWTWVPDIEKEVALFEEEYPAIDVKVVNAGQGAAHYQKLRTAIESGEGMPDVVQMEYQYIDSFTLTDSLLDLAPYGAADISGDYSEWVWNQVSREDAVFGIPQDSGPMGNLYRQDILEQAGVSEPAATWEQYAEDAVAVREKTDAYITNLAPNQAGQALGLLWQAGVKPFGYDGEETVTVNVNDERAKEVMSYWQDLIEKDLVSTDPDFTDQWYQGLANGKYAGWLTAAWGPVFLQGTAGETSGLWRAAELPQYGEGESVSGNWGGSSDAVLKSSENPVAAYELAKWINHDKSSTMMMATEQFLFPTHTEVLTSPEFLDNEAKFYGGQQVNQLFSEISETVDTEFEWLPYMDFAYSSYNETVGKAIADKGALAAGLDAWQEQLTTYGEDQGFTIK
jgi:multiple sugar transport system substrate-binding protein